MDGTKAGRASEALPAFVRLGWLVVFVEVLDGVNLTFAGELVVFKVFVVGCDFVDELAAGDDFHDAVGCGLDNLVVVGGE